MKNNFLVFTTIIFVLSCTKEDYHIVETCSKIDIADQQVQDIADKYANLGIPGIAIIYKKENEPVKEIYAGYASLKDKILVGNCHHFHSASLAKTIFAALTLKLSEQNKIDLNSTISDHLQGEFLEVLDNFKTVKVSQLLNHSSGIPNFYTVKHILKYFDNFDQTFTHFEMLQFIKNKSFEFQPGEKVNYSDSNYLILALILDQIVEGKDHIDLLYEELLIPLNLSDTYYDLSENYPKQNEIVNCYNDYYGDGKLQNVTDLERKFAEMNIGHDSFLAKPVDYFSFFYALISGSYLSVNSLEQMMTFTQYERDVFAHQSEGMGIRKTIDKNSNAERIGHFGATIGAGNAMLYYPENNAYLIVCTNFGRYFEGAVSDLFTTEFEDFNTQGNLIGDLEQYILN